MAGTPVSQARERLAIGVSPSPPRGSTCRASPSHPRRRVRHEPQAVPDRPARQMFRADVVFISRSYSIFIDLNSSCLFVIFYR